MDYQTKEMTLYKSTNNICLICNIHIFSRTVSLKKKKASGNLACKEKHVLSYVTTFESGFAGCWTIIIKYN